MGGRWRLADPKVNGKILMQRLWIKEGTKDQGETTSNTKEKRTMRVGDEKKDILQDQKPEGLEQDEHYQRWLEIKKS